MGLGELFMEMEDYEEAKEHFLEANSIYEKSGESTTRFFVLFPALCRLYVKTGDIAKADELINKTYEQLAALPKAKNRLATAYAEGVKAMILREQKNWEESIRYFDTSIQELKSLDAQKWFVEPLAQFLYEYGLVYVERNEKGDKDKARSLLTQALKIYQKADAKKRAERIAAELRLLKQ
jgi:tetratricopeptide (TPR) repeat protein